MENNTTANSQIKLQKSKPPKKAITVFLIISTLMLSLALVIGGVYSLYVSIGFSFLQGSAIGGINTSALYTYSNSGYGTGGGSMAGLIIISIIMLGLGVAMAVIFFKQMPLYKQIKLIAKMPNVKYKQYSAQVKKSVITFSIIAYFVCIGFCIFALVVAARQPLSTNYKWIVLLGYSIVLLLAISSMTLMFIKLSQLAKIKKQLQNKDLENQIKEQVEASTQQKTKDYLAKLSDSQDEVSNDSSLVYKGVKTQQNNTNSQLIEQQTQLINQITSVLDKMIEAQAAGGKDAENANRQPQHSAGGGNLQTSDSIFESGVFELSNALVKLREIHVSGLIDSNEYTQIRQKWINAVLKQPLFGTNKKSKAADKSKTVYAGAGADLPAGGVASTNGSAILDADAIKA